MAKIRCIQVTTRHHSSQSHNNDVILTSQHFATLKTFNRHLLTCTSSTDLLLPIAINVWRKQEESTSSPFTTFETALSSSSTSTHCSRSLDQNHYHQKRKMGI